MSRSRWVTPTSGCGRCCGRCRTTCSTRARICPPPEPKYPPLRITQDYIDRLEKWCDEFNAELAPLNSFILPGGTPLAALLHTARTVARRAERSAWAAVRSYPDDTSVLPAKYLNRLSDLLFILSRYTNPDGDVLWRPGGAESAR
ncbi:ATP:cob(I)alamin adenosyltransferase [Mycobacteroides abscessus subsp. abscessus]|nr:ATP:cob(I)alamin adenosyltransferase [Mycobacteroides abscessus subsp. abscessus]